MKKYEKITLQLICFSDEDIVTSSMIGGDGVYDGEVAEPEIWD